MYVYVSVQIVHRYSHDSALCKGEVFHQDVKTSVLIIEELPDPPVTHENREGLAGHRIKNTPISFRTAFYPLMEKKRNTGIGLIYKLHRNLLIGLFVLRNHVFHNSDLVLAIPPITNIN